MYAARRTPPAARRATFHGRRWPRGVVALTACVLAAVTTAGAILARGGSTDVGTMRPLVGESTSPPGVATSFGSIAIESVTRSRHHGVAHAAAGHSGKRTWATRVRVVLVLNNRLDEPVLFSPGQLRLRIGELDTTVAPLRAGRRPGAIPGRSSTRTWVSYLAPRRARRLSLDFADAQRGRLIHVALSRPTGADAHVQHGLFHRKGNG